MKKIIIPSLILLMAASSAHALLGGLGFHYAPNLMGGVESADESIGGLPLTRTEATKMQGFGTKLWIDILPIVDVEATGNVQFTEYDVEYNGMGIEAETGLPVIDAAKPMFALVRADLTITYPFFSIPALVKFYVGGGYTHTFSPKLINKDFLYNASGFSNDGASIPTGKTEQDIVTEAATAFKDEGFNSGVGGHIILGARTQLPVIPLAAYINAKYHVGGGLDDGATSGVTIEIGGGLSL
ncbi:MAG: hypothetical protein OCC49_01640 [Fibrobacterales bacterium]